METLNLNERVVGKTADGMILVALTMAEYLEALPSIPYPSAVGVEPRPADIQTAPPAPCATVARKPRKPRAIPAGGPPKKAVKASLGVRTCVGCGNEFTARRKDQVTCGAPACKRGNSLRRKSEAGKTYGRPRKPRLEIALTEEQKKMRLAAIREAARRVNARHAEEGSTLHVEGAEAAAGG